MDRDNTHRKDYNMSIKFNVECKECKTDFEVDDEDCVYTNPQSKIIYLIPDHCDPCLRYIRMSGLPEDEAKAADIALAQVKMEVSNV